MPFSINTPNGVQCPQLYKDIGAFVKTNSIFPKASQGSKSGPDANGEKVTEQNENTDNQESCRTSRFLEFHQSPESKIDRTHLAELTGTRSNVSKHSLERYSINEWKERNKNILDPSILHEANYVVFNGKSTINQAYGETDLKRNHNTDRLKERARGVHKWKVVFEHACEAIGHEILLLEKERDRIKQVFKALTTSESITKECIDLRRKRRIPDLVFDSTEHELNKEEALVNEIGASFKDILTKVEEQLVANKAAKQTLEYGRTDKDICYNHSETACLELTPKSNTIMFRHGAVRYADNNSTPQIYDAFCKDTVQNVEATRQRSVELRAILKTVIQNGAQKLKLQADATDMALVTNVRTNNEVCKKMEAILRDTLQSIADMETLIQNLQGVILKMDSGMKLAQTRLDIRNTWRPHIESVLDKPQIGLVQEVKQIHDTVSSLRAQLTNAMTTRQKLIDKRLELEAEIGNKMESIIIDKQRCQIVRSHYPDLVELCG